MELHEFWESVMSKDADSETVQNIKKSVDRIGLVELDNTLLDIISLIVRYPYELRETERWMASSLIKFAYTAIRNRLLEDGDINSDYEK